VVSVQSVKPAERWSSHRGLSPH